MRMLQVLSLLTAGPFLIFIGSMFENAYAADPNALAQVRLTRECHFCDLSDADLTKANLRGAGLTKANLRGAYLFRAKLGGADLSDARLNVANLSLADLTRADLTEAKLTEAKLSGADLIGASLSRANLTGVNLTGANLTNAQFEPATIPSGPLFTGAIGLDMLEWKDLPTGMVLLRNAFKEAGMRDEERQVTYAQLKTRRAKTGGLEGTLQYILFEATSDWSMSPARPLWMMLGLIPVFALLYTVPIARPSPTTALWRIWDKDRARKVPGQDEPEQLTVRDYRLPLYALFFSVLSTFQIGWRELNVGSWIARLNPYEFTLKGTGRVRTVSGLQSLASVYLLALAVLTYFGRPFE